MAVSNEPVSSALIGWAGCPAAARPTTRKSDRFRSTGAPGTWRARYGIDVVGPTSPAVGCGVELDAAQPVFVVLWAVSWERLW
jgi:hypothetical protein